MLAGEGGRKLSSSKPDISLGWKGQYVTADEAVFRGTPLWREGTGQGGRSLFSSVSPGALAWVRTGGAP